MIQCKRVYEASSPEDGYRILVDRLWPRGIKKTDLHYDRWEKALAPSTTLRNEWHHGLIDFAAFSKDYQIELEGQRSLARSLAEKSKNSTVTLLYGAKDTQYNHALVLAEFLRNMPLS